MSFSVVRNITPISRASLSPEVSAQSAASDAPARDSRTDLPRVAPNRTNRSSSNKPVTLEPHWQVTIDSATD